MTDQININLHSSVQVDDMFFDPYGIKNTTQSAKYVFITHTHYDHLSITDLQKIVNNLTTIFATHDAQTKLETHFPNNKIIYVEPNESFEYDNLKIETIPAYNLNKNFHKKEFGWVGYKITKNGISYLVVGDTDATPELQKVKCDVLFVPVGGTYTMTATEAAELANTIQPKVAIPTHYGSIVGTKHDGECFAKCLNKSIECKILIQ